MKLCENDISLKKSVKYVGFIIILLFLTCMTMNFLCRTKAFKESELCFLVKNSFIKQFNNKICLISKATSGGVSQHPDSIKPPGFPESKLLKLNFKCNKNCKRRSTLNKNKGFTNWESARSQITERLEDITIERLYNPTTFIDF